MPGFQASLAVRECAGAFSSAEGPGKGQYRCGKQDEREQKKQEKRMRDSGEACAAQKRGARPVQGEGYRIHMRHDLKPLWQDAYGEEHPARNTGKAQKQPFGRVAAFEQQHIGGRKNA